MHSDDVCRAVSKRGQLGDGDGRGVGGQDRVRGQDAIKGAEDFGFQFEALGGCLYGEVRGGEGFAVGGGSDASERRFHFGVGEFALGDFAAQVGANLAECAVEEALLHVAEQHAEP